MFEYPKFSLFLVEKGKTVPGCELKVCRYFLAGYMLRPFLCDFLFLIMLLDDCAREQPS